MIGARGNDIIEYIYSEDPALDPEHADFNAKKFLDSFDRKYLPVKDGVTPTVFKIRRLTRKRFMAIAGMAPTERANATVAYGVVGIDNFMLKSGSYLIPEFSGSGVDQHLTAATLDAMFDGGLFAELMNIIMAASGLDPLCGGHSGSSPG